MGDTTLEEIETRFTYTTKQVASFITELAEEIRARKIRIEGEEIALPNQFEMEYEFKEKTDQSKLEIELKW